MRSKPRAKYPGDHVMNDCLRNRKPWTGKEDRQVIRDLITMPIPPMSFEEDKRVLYHWVCWRLCERLQRMPLPRTNKKGQELWVDCENIIQRHLWDIRRRYSNVSMCKYFFDRKERSGQPLTYIERRLLRTHGRSNAHDKPSWPILARILGRTVSELQKMQPPNLGHSDENVYGR